MKKEVTVTLDEFAAQCARMLDEVVSTGEEVVVTRDGKPLVRISSEAGADAGRPSLAHYVRSIGDVISPVDEEWEASR
jgi:prevent-host-death family protein